MDAGGVLSGVTLTITAPFNLGDYNTSGDTSAGLPYPGTATRDSLFPRPPPERPTGPPTLRCLPRGAFRRTITLAAGRSLTLGRGGITVQAGSGAHEIRSTLSMQTWASAGASLTLSGPVGGSGALTISGTGVIVLAGANTHTGSLTVRGARGGWTAPLRRRRTSSWRTEAARGRRCDSWRGPMASRRRHFSRRGSGRLAQRVADVWGRALQAARVSLGRLPDGSDIGAEADRAQPRRTNGLRLGLDFVPAGDPALLYEMRAADDLHGPWTMIWRGSALPAGQAGRVDDSQNMKATSRFPRLHISLR